jgi:hypothetical protein
MCPILQLGAALLALALAGCASIGPPAVTRGTVAPDAVEMSAASATARRPLIQVVVDPASNESFRPRVEKLLSVSGLGVDLVLDGEPPRPFDFTLHLRFDFREVPLTDIEGVWAMTDALLLTLYPATCNRYRFTLDARVEDAAGREFKTYSLQDVDTAWVWLLMGPKCSSPEGLGGEGVGDAAEQLLKGLYGRMARDGVLDPTRAAAVAAARGPLVYVTTNRAEELIREGFRLEESPLRFSFAASRPVEAEYTLRLDLAFSGRGYSAGRALLALMTVGLSGVCPTQTATLEGSAFDRQGQLLGHYRADAHWQPSMTTDCALQGESDRPEMVRELALDLQRQITPASLTAAATASPPSGAPLVGITTNAVRPVVERVTSERRPFERVTLEESPAAPLDYRFDLQFSSSGGGMRADPSGSMAKQLAVGFAFGLTLGNSALLCKPTTYQLSANLADAAGGAVATYQASKTATTREMGCGAESEPPPVVAAALLEQVYAQLMKDPRRPPELRRQAARSR